MAKKHRNIGNNIKRFLLLMAVSCLYLLPACSHLGNLSQEEEAIKLIDEGEQKSPKAPTPSVAKAPSPDMLREEGPKTEAEDNPEQTTGPVEAPTATGAPDTTVQTDETWKPSPSPAHSPSKEPDRKAPSKEITDMESSGEKAAKPTAIPKPSGMPERPVQTPPPKEGSLRLEDYADEILEQIITKGMTEVEKVKAVHDYIVLNTAYYENKKLKPEAYPEDVFTAKGALLQGEAVCQGYAEAFQMFMDRLGINSKFVVGKDRINQVGHAWNMVSLDGKWYHVDVTWDDPVPDQKGQIQYKYFLITDEMISVDHSWNQNNYPACDSTDYLYYIYEDVIIASIDLYEETFVSLYQQGERTITILYPEEEKPDLSFFFAYDFLHTIDKDGTKHMAYKHYPIRRLGNYSVYTVIVD